MLKELIARLKEPSTMAGFSALALLAGMPQNTVTLAGQAVAALLAVGAVLVPEKK